MEAELLRGKLIRVREKNLTIIDMEGVEDLYPHEGLGIDEDWIKDHMGRVLEFTVINGVIKSVSPT